MSSRRSPNVLLALHGIPQISHLRSARGDPLSRPVLAPVLSGACLAQLCPPWKTDHVKRQSLCRGRSSPENSRPAKRQTLASGSAQVRHDPAEIASLKPTISNTIWCKRICPTDRALAQGALMRIRPHRAPL